MSKREHLVGSLGLIFILQISDYDGPVWRGSRHRISSSYNRQAGAGDIRGDRCRSFSKPSQIPRADFLQANVLISDDQRPVLSDFGLATAADNPSIPWV